METIENYSIKATTVISEIIENLKNEIEVLLSKMDELENKAITAEEDNDDLKEKNSLLLEEIDELKFKNKKLSAKIEAYDAEEDPEVYLDNKARAEDMNSTTRGG